jgi:hypothetical protein
MRHRQFDSIQFTTKSTIVLCPPCRSYEWLMSANQCPSASRNLNEELTLGDLLTACSARNGTVELRMYFLKAKQVHNVRNIKNVNGYIIYWQVLLWKFRYGIPVYTGPFRALTICQCPQALPTQQFGLLTRGSSVFMNTQFTFCWRLKYKIHWPVNRIMKFLHMTKFIRFNKICMSIFQNYTHTHYEVFEHYFGQCPLSDLYCYSRRFRSWQYSCILVTDC